MRHLYAGHDVLPAIGMQERGFQPRALASAHGTAASLGEVPRILAGLQLEQSVNGAYEIDEVFYGCIARSCIQLRVFAAPLQLVEDRMLRFFLPVEQEHVLPERIELAVGL